jgi:hypothetical protein
LDAEGVTPELKLRLKFYCSWTWNFFFVCLFLGLFCFLFVCSSLHIDFFGYFVCLFVSFTIVN